MLFDSAENRMFAPHGLAVYRLTNPAAAGLLPFLRPYPLRISTANASRARSSPFHLINGLVVVNSRTVGLVAELPASGH
jgi:hypothetical protein